jgi:hypothetical protein
MVRYNYDKIWILSRGDSNLIVHYFKQLVNKEGEYTALLGDNYMISPNIIMNNTRYPARVLAEYIGLCALRPYSAYAYQGIVSLPLEYCPSYIAKTVVDSCPWVHLKGSRLEFPRETLRKNLLNSL